MNVCVLGSGSKGNCTLIESGRTSVLIDAGFSGKEISRRLSTIGRGPESLSAVLVTHEHNDHVSGAGIISRLAKIPLYANAPTHAAAEKYIGRPHGWSEFGTGEQFTIGDLQIHPFAISHDTADPVGFVLTDGQLRVGYCTDTGKITALIAHHLHSCHLLVLESNHDPQMLRDGPYPLRLQQRITSNRGHLSNGDAGRLLRQMVNRGLSHVILAHLSECNNQPEVALRTLQEELGPDREGLRIVFAAQHQPSPLVSL